MATMIDTAGAGDNSEETSIVLTDSPSSAEARRPKPAPRAVKQKKYRELLKKKQEQLPKDLVTFLLQIVQGFRSLDSDARIQHNRDIATFYQYYDGNEYGEFNEAGDWQPDSQNSEGFSYTMPLVPAHVDAGKTLLTKVNLEYEYTPKNKISVLDGQVAKMCEELAEEEIQRILPDDKRTLERLYLLLAGKSWRHLYWAPNPLEADEVEVDVYDNEETQLNSMRICDNEACGTPLGETDTVCPKCLSDRIKTVEGGTVNKIKTRTETRQLSENQLYIPNPLAIQQDLSKRDINSSFIVERDTLPRARAEFTYCQTFTERRGGVSADQKMIRELERARLRTGAVHGNDEGLIRSLATAEVDLAERERAWLEPWRYANFLITEQHWYISKQDGIVWCEDPADVPDGAKHIEPGTFLGDICPAGLNFVVVEDEGVQIKPEPVSDRWMKLTCGMRPSNVDGAGMKRLRPLADMANDSTNLEFKVLMDDADPKTFLNRSYLSSLSKVGEYNVVDALKNGESWESVVHRLAGASTHPALGVMNERVQGMAQFLVGTYSSMGQGAPDAKAFGTATGVVAMQEEAAGRFVEAILQTAKADIDLRYKVLNNIRRFSITPQIDELKARFGVEVVKHFLECNLRKLLVIKKKKGSDQPQSQALKLAQLQSYSDAVATVGQSPNAQSLMEGFADMIDLPVTIGIGLADKEEANRRIGWMRDRLQKFNDKQIDRETAVIEAIKLMAAMIEDCERDVPAQMDLSIAPQVAGTPQLPPVPSMDGQPVDGQMIPEAAPALPVSSVIMMQEHTVFADAAKDWLFTEGARCNNVVLTTAIQMMWTLHDKRQILKQNELVRIEVERQKLAAPPAPPMPTPDEMSEQERAAKEEAIVTEVLAREADEHSKDEDARRKGEEKDADLQRDLDKIEYQAEINKENQPIGGQSKK